MCWFGGDTLARGKSSWKHFQQTGNNMNHSEINVFWQQGIHPSWKKNNTEAISRLLPVTLYLMSPCVSLPLIILDQQPCLVCSLPQDKHFMLCSTKVAFNKRFLTFLRGRAVTETGIIWLVVVNVNGWSQKTKLSLACWLEWIVRSTWGEKPQQW